MKKKYYIDDKLPDGDYAQLKSKVHLAAGYFVQVDTFVDRVIIAQLQPFLFCHRVKVDTKSGCFRQKTDKSVKSVLGCSE